MSKGSFTHPAVEERAPSCGFSSSLWLVVLADTKAFIFFRFFWSGVYRLPKAFFSSDKIRVGLPLNVPISSLGTQVSQGKCHYQPEARFNLPNNGVLYISQGLGNMASL